MPSTIITKNGSGAPLAADLVAGELAVDLTNKRLYTEDSGGTVLELGTNPASDVTFGDNVKAVFGAGSDLEILSNGTDGLIRNGNATGEIRMESDDRIIFADRGFNEVFAVFNDDDDVKLYHDGNQKLATTATGIDITGTVTADGLTVDTNTLVVDAANNRVGIGTSSPAYPLHVWSDTTIARFGGTDTNDTYLNIFKDNASSIIKVQSSKAGAGATDVAINPDGGKVGIGTDSPEADLHVVGASNTNSTVQISSATTGYAPILRFDGVVGALADNLLGVIDASWDTHTNTVASIRFESGADTTNKDDGLISFWTSESSSTVAERMRIDSSGNIIFGTTGQGYINGAAPNTYNSGYDQDSDSFATWINYSGYQGGTTRHRDFIVGDGKNARVATFDGSSGNVGIGTASSGFKLDVNAGASPSAAQFQSSSSTYADFLNGTITGRIQTISSDFFIGTATAGASLAFKTDNNTEAMRIDSSGNVHIGAGTASTANLSIITSGQAGGIQLNRNTSSQPTSGQSLGSYAFKGVDSANSNAAAEAMIEAVAAETHSGSTAATNMIFYTKASGTGPGSAPTPRMTLDASGNLLVGTTDTTLYNNTSGGGAAFMIVGDGIRLDLARDGDVATFNRMSGTGTLLEMRQGGAVVGTVTVTASTTAYNTSSDYRLKENVVAMSGATERLKQLKPSRFNFIADPDTTVDGFLAHEVQDVVPEAITGTKDAMRDEEYEITPAVLDDEGNVITEAVMGTRSVPEYQGIDQSKLVPLLVATIQELEARIAALEGAN